MADVNQGTGSPVGKTSLDGFNKEKPGDFLGPSPRPVDLVDGRLPSASQRCGRGWFGSTVRVAVHIFMAILVLEGLAHLISIKSEESIFSHIILKTCEALSVDSALFGFSRECWALCLLRRMFVGALKSIVVFIVTLLVGRVSAHICGSSFSLAPFVQSYEARLTTMLGTVD